MDLFKNAERARQMAFGKLHLYLASKTLYFRVPNVVSLYIVLEFL